MMTSATYDAAIICRLDELQISYRRVSQDEIAADVEGTGHRSFKINLAKGAWFCTDGSGRSGGLRALFALLGDPHVPPAILAARPVEDVAAHREESFRKAKAKWGKGWIVTHSEDFPGGWDRGLNTIKKGFLRTKLNEERNRAFAYVRSRFYDPLAAIRMGKVGRSDFGDPALLWQIADFSGNLVGVQEVILLADGSKRRLVWGQSNGVVSIPAPTGVRPFWASQSEGRWSIAFRENREKNFHPLIVWSEGVETGAASSYALGVRGFAAISANGLIKRAKEWAGVWREKGAGKVPPCILLCVDRDKSETGQRAAARAAAILRRAGIPALLAIPPAPEDGGPKGGEKGSDWGDYPREGISVDVLRAHLCAQVLVGDEILADYLAEAEAADEDIVSGEDNSQTAESLAPWVRPAENPVDPVATVPLQVGQRHARHLLRRYAIQTVRWQKAKEAGKRAPAPAPMMLALTTGTGKSTALRGMIRLLTRARIRTLIVVPKIDDALRYEKAGAVYARGRKYEKKLEWGAPHHCAKVRSVGTLAARHHSPALDACHTHCEHGLKAAFLRGKSEETKEQACQSASKFEQVSASNFEQF